MKLAVKNILYFLISFLIIGGSLSFEFIGNTEKEDNPDSSVKYESKYFQNKNISDGPYLFHENERIIVKWINGGRLVEKSISNNNFKVIKRKFGFDFNAEWLKDNYDSIDYKQQYYDVENLIAISDIHGQYDLFIKLLKQYNVVDKDFNWIFGTGHLVIVGDIFNRGPTVTESLWLVYRLEQQAAESGGKVHVLLGNHELMVINNDLRYINTKYAKTAQLMGTSYSELYSEKTFIGKWIRSKPVIVTINDMLFVHAGISPEFVTNGLTPEKTNELFTNNIVGHSWKSILESKSLSFLTGMNGPVWHRGYFRDTLQSEQQVDKILDYFNISHIIVGHTSFPNIVSLFNGKIFGIDSSIKYGEYGEVFIYSNGKFSRGSSNGTIINF